MSQFSTKGHVAEEKSYESDYLSPGIVTAKMKIEHMVSTQKGTDGIKIILEGKPAEGKTKGQTCESTWWMSEGAWQYTKDRLCIMADKLGCRAELDAIEASSAQEYVLKLSKVFNNKAARFKLIGKEIAGKEGKQNWFKAELANFGFIEPLTVPANESKLTFNPENKYDMVKLPAADTAATTASSSSDDVAW